MNEEIKKAFVFFYLSDAAKTQYKYFKNIAEI